MEIFLTINAVKPLEGNYGSRGKEKSGLIWP